MKTLVIVSHPNLIDSGSQQFFLSSVEDFDDVTIHHLEKVYPDGKIDATYEQELLRQHDRILFQFPFYWYSSPPLLKHWQDVVLDYGFAYGTRGNMLEGKEFGLVLMIGVSESEYQAGGNEQFSISELTKPYQAVAHKTKMTYLKPFTIFQFSYMNEDKKMDMLIKYQQMLTMENNQSLETREKWMIEQLEKPNQNDLFTYVVSHIQENRNTIDELTIVLDQMFKQ